MTRDALTDLGIKREILRAEAARLRDLRDMAGAAKVEADLRRVNLEILRRGKGTQ